MLTALSVTVSVSMRVRTFLRTLGCALVPSSFSAASKTARAHRSTVSSFQERRTPCFASSMCPRPPSLERWLSPSILQHEG